VFHKRGDKDLLQIARGDHALVKSKFPQKTGSDRVGS